MKAESVEAFVEKKRAEYIKFKDMAIRNTEAFHMMSHLSKEWECKEYPEDYEGAVRTADVHLSDNHTGVNVWLGLDREDSIEKEVALFVEKIEETLVPEGFRKNTVDEYVNGQWLRVPFFNLDDRAAIHIFFNYAPSAMCKLVGTGEFIEKQKRMCI